MLLFSRMFAAVIGGEPAPLGALVETFDISDFSGGAYITIPTIDGRPLSDFAFIYGFFNNAIAASGNSLQMQLSVDGSVWRGGSADYRNSSTDAGTASVADATSFRLYDSVDPWDCIFHITDIGLVAPTTVRCHEVQAGEASPARHVNRAAAGVADTAIRFFSANLGNWTSGSLILMGILKHNTTVQIHDFNADPVAERVFTVPVGHTVGTLHIVAGVTASGAQPQVQVGIDGVFLSGSSDYHGNFMHQSSSLYFSAANMGIAGSNETLHDGMMELWALRTPAPVTVFIKDLKITSNSAETWTILTADGGDDRYNEVKLFNDNAETFTDGIAYFVTYAINVDIEIKDFGAASATSHDFKDLDNYPIVLVVGPALTLTGNSGIRARVSTDGTNFDSGSSDYARQVMTHALDIASHENEMDIGPGDYSSHGFCTLFGGFGINVPLQASEGWTVNASGNTAYSAGAIRRTTQVNTAVRIFNSASKTFNGGKLYRLGFDFLGTINDPHYSNVSVLMQRNDNRNTDIDPDFANVSVLIQAEEGP